MMQKAIVGHARAQAAKGIQHRERRRSSALRGKSCVATWRGAICITRPKGRIVMFRALFPYPYQIEVSKLRRTELSIRRQLEQVHLAWVAEWKRRQADFEIENVRFTHDPDWNKRLFSIQAAHDGRGFFWGSVRVFVAWDLFPLGAAIVSAPVVERLLLAAAESEPLSQPRATRWREPGR
jgi:hypothetical protein